MKNDIICLEATALLRQLEPGSVPLIIVDPPYGIGYHSNYYREKNPHAPMSNDWNFQIGAFIEAAYHTLSDGGALYLFSRWDVFPIWLAEIQTHKGLKLKTKIVWVKNNWSAGDLRGSFGAQYEEILFLVKGRHLLRGKCWSNIWPFNRIPASKLLHPAQKPVPLLKRAILASSDEGDLVVDPFAGSGNTAAAAQETGRSFLCGDIARARLGLAVDIKAQETARRPLSEYLFEYPDPAAWGIHPEELRYILDALQGNISAFALETEPLLARCLPEE